MIDKLQRALFWLIGPLVQLPKEERGDKLFLMVVTVGAIAMLLDTKHTFRPPHAEDVWTFATYGALALAAAVWWELRGSSKGHVLAALGTLAVVTPMAARVFLVDWGKARAHDPNPILFPVLAGVALLLLAAWRGGARIERFGLGLGDWRWWMPRFLALTLIVELIVLGAAWASPEIRSFYPEYKPARTSGWELAKYQASLGMYMLGWEAFHRGFFLFGLARRGDSLVALFFMAFPFFLLHWHKPEIEMISSFWGSVAAGWICLRAGSFLPVFGLHWVMNLSMEVTCFLLRQSDAG